MDSWRSPGNGPSPEIDALAGDGVQLDESIKIGQQALAFTEDQRISAAPGAP